MPTADNPLGLLRVDGRVALVTGGTPWVGRGDSRGAFLGRGIHGCDEPRWATLAESAERIARTTGGRAVAIPGDVADGADAIAAIERTVAELGGLDILVNSPGINIRGFIEAIDRAAFEGSRAVNVTGAVEWALSETRWAMRFRNRPTGAGAPLPAAAAAPVTAARMSSSTMRPSRPVP